MNYRHAFHAGNFADVVKHAALLQVVAALTSGREPLRVIDTHAGGGAYDLGGEAARRSGEAENGVRRLMAANDAPESLGRLVAAVRRLNPDGGARFYPGSPLLAVTAIRPGDRFIGCELRPDDYESLRGVLKPYRNAEARRADGYAAAADAPSFDGRELVVIDPPFERPDDYGQVVRTVRAVIRRDRRASVMVWLPIKDLETFDSFIRDLEDAAAGEVTVAEARVRPLTDPMKMNGCALAFLNLPKGLEPALGDLCDWVVRGFGAGGSARIWQAD